MMTVATVISLRGLPMIAKEGLDMFFYLAFGAVLVLLPASLVAAELGGAFAHVRGGIYGWVKAAFGPRWGFVAMWLQWTMSVVLFPTILGFAAGSLAYLVLEPELAASGWYNAIITVVVYWTATFIILRGGRIASSMTSWTFILGTALPGLVLMVLAAAWILAGGQVELAVATGASPAESGTQVHPVHGPHFGGLHQIAFLAAILLVFTGVETQASHGGDLKNPASELPKVMLATMATAFVIFSFGAIAVGAVVPASEISLTAGTMQAYQSFLHRFGLGFMTPFFGLLLAAGAIGGLMAWILGPSKGLLATAQDGHLPPFLARTNKNGIQANILLVQGCIVTVFASLYLLAGDVSVAFFVLTVMSVSVHLVMYMLLYAAAIRLRYTRTDLPRTFKVPGGNLGMWLVAGTGLLAVSFGLAAGFYPPDNLTIDSPTLYVALVAGGLVLCVGSALVVYALRKPAWSQDESGNTGST